MMSEHLGETSSPETDTATVSPDYPYITHSTDDHILTLKRLSHSDFDNEKEILALPRRRNRSQRPLAIQLAKSLYPELSDVAATIKYERLTRHAKALVRQKQKDRTWAQLHPEKNDEGKLLKIQGPWAGQEIDPLDLKGPTARPMPVTIGEDLDFDPIFRFLAQDKPITNAGHIQGTHGLEPGWNNPLLEFSRGIIYEDGRLDLCKMVVGPTHIGKLMESLEPNHHIRHFLLGNNCISITGAKRIAEFLGKYPDRMETWYLAGCNITQRGLSLLVPGMINSKTITNLWFKRNPFGPNAYTLLADLIVNIVHLRTLDLDNTELGDEGTRLFIDAICGRSVALQHLYLNANGIGESACASLAKYLAHPNCALESLFLSANPIGDTGMRHLSGGLAKNKTLKRLTCGSTGLTGNGISYLATALSGASHPLQVLDLGASKSTNAHGQKYNYLDDDCVESLKILISLTSLRWLNLGHVIFGADAIQQVRTAAAGSELVCFNVSHRPPSGIKTARGTPDMDNNAPVVKSCSLEVRNQLVKNQAKYYPHIEDYNDFLKSEDCRFLRNTSDVRKIDSLYRTRDQRRPVDQLWAEGDPTWKMIVDDAETAEII